MLTSITTFWETLERKLSKIWSIRVEVVQVGRTKESEVVWINPNNFITNIWCLWGSTFVSPKKIFGSHLDFI